MSIEALLRREDSLTPAERKQVLDYFNTKQRELTQAKADLNHKLDARAWVSAEGSKAVSQEMVRYSELANEVDEISRRLWVLGRRGVL